MPVTNVKSFQQNLVTRESFTISWMTKEIIQQGDYFVSIGLFHQTKLYSVQCTLHKPVYTALLYQAFLQCTQDIFVYSDIGMVYSGICVDLENRHRLDSVLYIDKCTLQYSIRLFIGYI